MKRLVPVVERHPNIVVAIIFAYLLAAGGTVIYLINEQRAVSDESHRALCAFRGDLDRRVADTQAFLREHPHGIPGITAANLELSIKNQEMTIQSLRFVRCSGDG